MKSTLDTNFTVFQIQTSPY